MLAECVGLGCHCLLFKHSPGDLEFLVFRVGFRNAVFKPFLWHALLRREGLICSGNRELRQPRKQKRIYATSPSSLVSQKYITLAWFAQTCLRSDWGFLFSFITVLKDSSGPSQPSVAQSDSEDDGEFQSQPLWLFCDC